MKLPRRAMPLLLLLAPKPAAAQACAPTPQAAARQAIDGAAIDGAATGASNEGYRVEDAQADLVLGRVWLRVRRCGSPEAPMILVPLQASLRSSGVAGGAGPAWSSGPGRGQEAESPVGSPGGSPQRTDSAVHAGDTVRVVAASETIQIELEATVRQQASVGDTVDVVLNQRGAFGHDETGQRMRGILRAQHIVEVHP